MRARAAGDSPGGGGGSLQPDAGRAAARVLSGSAAAQACSHAGIGLHAASVELRFREASDQLFTTEVRPSLVWDSVRRVQEQGMSPLMALLLRSRLTRLVSTVSEAGSQACCARAACFCRRAAVCNPPLDKNTCTRFLQVRVISQAAQKLCRRRRRAAIRAWGLLLPQGTILPPSPTCPPPETPPRPRWT